MTAAPDAEPTEIDHTPLPPPRETGKLVLSRYRVVERDTSRYIVGEDANNVRLYIQPGLVVDEEERRNFTEQVIFLDGAYRGAPFLDNERRQYSFDHHEGCVRAFTLASCEQAAVMLLKGLPISEGKWKVYINQPDLDALLAAWVLINHQALLQSEAELLGKVMPLLRVEGVIDVHGLEMKVLSGLADEEYATQKQRLDQLMIPEREHREAGTWAQVDMVDYSCDRLAAIDALLAEAGYLRDRAQVEVVAQREIQGGKTAVLCRSTGGIYAVEARLRELLGKSLGIIILENAERSYTLKQVDPFLSRDLVTLYQALNARDPEAKAQADSPANQWGGSADIGGSPRGTGTGLQGEEVLEIASRIFRGASWFGRLLGRRR